MDTTPGQTQGTTYARFERRANGVKDFVGRMRNDVRLSRRVLMGGGIALTLFIGLMAYLLGGRYAGTNDAYVRAAQLLVTPDISGLVLSVDVKQGQVVKKGDVLFRLDPMQFQNALDTARSNLQQTALDIEAMKSDYARMVSDIDAQDAQVALDQRTYDRYASLVQKDNISKANYDEARLTLAQDTQKGEALKRQAESQLAKLGGRADLPPSEHPMYLKAQAAVNEAQRQLDHTVVRAPFSGIVTEVDSLQPGTLVITGLASFSTTSSVGLVSNTDLWVEAEMKETDLAHVKVGDAVDVKVDTYHGRRWKGTVTSVSPATGGSFSILPAQNASGNWVKVVQRVGVRIDLDIKPEDPPLRAGLSTVVSIDTGHSRWYRTLFGG